MFAGSRLLLPVHINFITLVPESREEGGTRCQRALAAEGDRGAEEIGQQEEAETASGCPKRWCWSKRRTVGRKTRCRAPGTRRGGCHPRGSGGVAPFAWRPKPAAIRHVWGGAGNGGLAAGCPRPEEPPPSARRRRDRAVHQRCPVPSHGTAREPLSLLRTERQCVREPDRDFFFSSLPSLISVTPHPSVSFSLASSVLTPRYAAAALTGYPRERGEGGSRAQSRGYPRPARGDGGMWRVGRGREPWERSEAGGVIGNERHLHHSPVSSPTEELRKG